MGLISYFRNLYYDNKFKKAERLLTDGRTVDAEYTFLCIVDKHPLAAIKLAEHYLGLSSSATIKDDISLFKKTVELKTEGANVYDPALFEPILSQYIKHIQERANESFDSGHYKECHSLTSVLKETKTNSSDDSILYSEARIRLLYNNFSSVKVTDNTFKTLIDAFDKEWAVCKGKKRAKDSALQFCQSLTTSKRYYASNQLLSIVQNDSYDSLCLDNAALIIGGNDTEATPDIIKSVALNYTKPIILRKGIQTSDAIKIFVACWKATLDNNVVMDVLQSANDIALRDALVNEILQNHKTYLSSTTLYKDFTKWLYDSFDGEQSLGLLEKVHGLGYDVKEYYTQKTHTWTGKLAFEKRLPYLDHAQKLFPESVLITDDKLTCAQQFLDKGDNEKAIAVSESIIDKCEKAKLVKAQALCNIANKESNLDRRIELLTQALTTLSTCSGSEKSVIKNKIIDAFVLAAKSYYNEGSTDKSYTILNSLAKEGSENAVFAIAELRLHEVQSEQSVEGKLNKTTDAIGEILRFNVPVIAENQDYQQLWNEKISLLLDKSKHLDNSAAVTHFESIIHEIEGAGFDPSATKEKKDGVVKQLIKRKYLIAREQELANNLTDASKLYKEINGLEAKRTPTLSAIRFIICKLKMQNNSDVLEHREQIYTILRKSAAAYKSEKEDIAYRFALILLKSGEDQEALTVLNEFLPGEDYLIKACAQGAIIKALAKLEDFNNKLDSVKNKTLSSNDAVYFINHMLEYAEVIKPVLDLPRPTLTKYRNKLKNYAIFKLFDEERYDEAFEKMVKEHKDYLDDYTALRNIALVCLNMAEAKQITTGNYQDVISIWLTAIYQEKLFVKSLDYTSWDDPFTFSLYEAYGHFDEDSVGTLPDNVNFDNSSDDSVVLIKEVQRTLLDRFEAAISDDQQYHEFFTSQKDAMDAFIALKLEDKCRLVAPYLAHKDEDLFQDISNALEQDRKQEYDNWENLLSVGALYQMPQAIYTDYSKAKSYYDDCIATIDSMNSNNARQAFLSSKIELIKRFGKLYSALKSYSNSKVSALSAKDKDDFKNNYNFYLVVCSALKDNTLSFVFSNYVMQYVVGEVNSNSMKKSEASGYILSIFALDKNNSRVKENLTALFEMLARESSSDSTKAVANILDRVRNVDSAFYSQLNKEFENAKVDKELSEIVDKVNNGSINNSAALDKVYSLYSKMPNNSRICANLAQLCCRCIVEYVIGQKYGSSSVERTLNSINSNKSSEFRKQSSSFRDAYNSIWGQLPYSTKTLLEGGSFASLSGQTLNDKGLALKRGLNLMKSLGGFTSGSSSTIPDLDFLRSMIDDTEYPF